MKSLLLIQVCLLGSALSNKVASRPNEDERKLSNVIGTFGHTLSQRLVSLNPHGNMLFSPYSVATAMSIALQGAGGETKQEMLNAMNLQGINLVSLKRGYSSLLSHKHENATLPTDPFPSESFILLAANRLFIANQFEIKNEFKSDIQQNFGADALSADFANNGVQVQRDINAFVEDRTNGLIKDILRQPLSPRSILAIINTLYFKGSWVKKMAELQETTKFNEGCGDLASVHKERLAITSRFKYIDSAVLQAQMILLPYIHDDYSAEMLILLPKVPHACNMQPWLDQVAWNTIKSELKRANYQMIALEMPAFELNGRYNLEEVLPALGMPLAFTPGKANFSGISNQPLNIDTVIHQAKMIVTRYGTEAAAATVLGITRLSAEVPIEPIPMNINRSFYLSIIYHHKDDDEAPLPLFTGVVHRV